MYAHSTLPHRFVFSLNPFRRILIASGSAPLLLLLFIGFANAAPVRRNHPSTGAIGTGGGCGMILVADAEAALRQAVDCLNRAPTGTYTLSISADITFTAVLTPIVNPALTRLQIAGNGHTLNAAGHGRVLTLAEVPNLLLQRLTLTGGRADLEATNSDGGGLSLRCSDDRVCQWTLLESVIQGNQAFDGGGIDYYCAYHGGGGLLVQDSQLHDNVALNGGGGLFFAADEESNGCTLVVANSVVEANHAADGGALRSFSTPITITNSTVRNNTATDRGGGIMLRKSDGFIDMFMRNSTVSGNRAGSSGGGLYIASPEQNFAIQIANSTISSNIVISGTGGGLYLSENTGSLHIDLLNSTITRNNAASGAGVFIYNTDGGSGSSLYLANSLIADNLGNDCAGTADPTTVYTGQRIDSTGTNLDGDGSCLTAAVRQPTDLPAANANLALLADNGGPNQTHALLPDSAAIDAGNDAICTVAPVSGRDQRGVARPQERHCDIGAYEFVTPLQLFLPLIYW